MFWIKSLVDTFLYFHGQRDGSDPIINPIRQYKVLFLYLVYDHVKNFENNFTPNIAPKANEKKFKKNLISIEKKIQLNNTTKRFDILAHDINGGCILLVECKAPNIKINQESFDQILRYNQVVNAKFLIMNNK